MRFSTLSIARTSSSPSEFWGNAQRLVIIVATTDVADVLVAYGVDPEHGVGPEHSQQVFETSVWANQLGSFFKFLVDGNPGAGAGGRFESVALGGITPDPNSVDVPAQQPPPPGPKAQVVLTYAAAVRSGESLAEVGEPVSA
jgi:hypothetical protein